MSDDTNDIKGFYNKGYKYNDRKPFFINDQDLTDKQKHLLTESDTFCMLPWVHMHAFPDGRAYPCCLADYWHPVGDLRQHTMEEIWNQRPLRKMRKNMLEGQPSVQCTKCYEQEKNGLFSMRYDSNRNYGHHIAQAEATNLDGSVDDFKIRYWDVRFSNLCNFSCRTCGPIFSSNWYNEHVKLYGKKPDVLGREMMRIEYAAGDEQSMLKQMEPHIPYLEQVYFAGGEPLIMKEHYFMLEKLLEQGKTDIRIQYNTNFSELAFKDKHVFEYWRHFKNISVGASLDASGSRAELMRKGTKWSQTVDNRIRMLQEVPHVDFYIAATVSSMNALHVPDFHREWVELGLIKAKDFNINVCQGPEWYRADILPSSIKNQINSKYEKHLEWLEPQDSLKRATLGYKGLLNFINSKNSENLIPRFLKEVSLLDQTRSEDFFQVFPELLELKNYEST